MANFQHCKYREIFGQPRNDSSLIFGVWSEPFVEEVTLGPEVEYILVVCENNASEIVSKTYHALIARRPEFEELDMLKLKKRQVEVSPKETLNVIMIGLDGLSRHQFLRSMSMTQSFLNKGNNTFDMTMHTQTGTNTFPNYVPLLTGRSDTEIERYWNSKKHYTDVFGFVWKDFMDAGYKTLFSEDVPSIGGFHFMKKGFLSPPTTYYTHPICLAIERDEKIWKAGRYCIGNTPEIVFHFNYIEKMFDTFKDVPLYAMAFITKLTHGDMTLSKRVDEHILNFYTSLEKKGHLNNTLLITFSDHGPRWGSIRATMNGMVESRAPYLFLTFPQWFLDKYPDVAANLKTNTRRLTSHVDTHATLQDLIYFKATGNVPIVPDKLGISLFREIPKNRTCDDAKIPMEFCLCNQNQMKMVFPNSAIFQKLAELLLKSINSKHNSSYCVELSLHKVLQIVEIMLPFVGRDDKRLYKVKVQTTPGDAVYEGTVKTPKVEESILLESLEKIGNGTKIEDEGISMGKTVDRLTLYKGQADCEVDAARKPYCYCKNLIVV
ncbi:uncharacterized protein LOC131954692 [Physella acuta]|uniref:uncharacterized protein LOC131954692 n=1 Tax=Physella acuta TaxID=109671 RepID=UPI0027DDBFC9|nr:uncharacterized protein LOC131954692 [Physella acuta]